MYLSFITCLLCISPVANDMAKTNILCATICESSANSNLTYENGSIFTLPSLQKVLFWNEKNGLKILLVLEKTKKQMGHN